MSKKVVLVGHCGADNSYLRMAVTSALRSATVLAADDSTELDALLAEGVDLLLLNRELGWGFEETEGVDVIRSLRTRHPNLRTMLVSNYAEAQAAAVVAGALPGFGKREIGSARVTQVLREALADSDAVKQV
jgi:DNA-binding NarL/FixJ family response regulator